MTLNYLKGDATQPAGTGPRVVPHICNDVGGWGAGFVVALSRRWKEPEQAYRRLIGRPGLYLGAVQTVEVEPKLWVANMVAQHGIGRRPDGSPPIRYGALRNCLAKVALFAQQHNASIHAPKFGAGLAGGDWDIIEQIIREELVALGLNVTVYEFGD